MPRGRRGGDRPRETGHERLARARVQNNWPGGKGKGGGKGTRDTRECFRCGHVGHIRAKCTAKKHKLGGPCKEPRALAKKLETEDDDEPRLGGLDICALDVDGDDGSVPAPRTIYERLVQEKQGFKMLAMYRGSRF